MGKSIAVTGDRTEAVGVNTTFANGMSLLEELVRSRQPCCVSDLSSMETSRMSGLERSGLRIERDRRDWAVPEPAAACGRVLCR